MLNNWLSKAIALLYLVFSFQTITAYKDTSYDLDEIFSFYYAKSIDSFHIPSLIDRDLGNPPLFFILLKPWIAIFTNEWSVRFLSFVFFSFSLVIFIKILEQLKIRRFSSTIGIILLLGVYYKSPIINYLRPYTLLSLMTLATVYLTFAAQSGKLRFRWLLPLIVMAGFLTHYIYWLFYFFWVLVNFYQRKETSTHIKYLLIGSMLVSPLILHLFFREIITPPDYVFHQKLGIWPGPSSWLYHLTKLKFILGVPKVLSFFVWLVFLAKLTILGARERVLKRKTIFLFTAISWAIYLFSPLHDYLSHEKYLNFMVPILLMSFILVIEPWLQRMGQLTRGILLIILIFWAFSLDSSSFYLTIPMNDNWRTATREVSQVTNANIVTDCLNLPGLDYYLQREIKVYSFSKNDCDLPVIEAHYQKLLYIAEFELDQQQYDNLYRLDRLSEHGYVKVGYLERK